MRTWDDMGSLRAKTLVNPLADFIAIWGDMGSLRIKTLVNPLADFMAIWDDMCSLRAKTLVNPLADFIAIWSDMCSLRIKTLVSTFGVCPASSFCTMSRPCEELLNVLSRSGHKSGLRTLMHL